jgi:hypothetical protein
MGAIFLGIAADVAFTFSNFDQYGEHLLPALFIGMSVAIGAYYLSSANQPAE